MATINPQRPQEGFNDSNVRDTKKTLNKKELDHKLNQVLKGRETELQSLNLEELKQIKTHIDNKLKVLDTKSPITKLFDKIQIKSLQTAKGRIETLQKNKMEQWLLRGHNDSIEDLIKTTPPGLKTEYQPLLEKCRLTSYDETIFNTTQEELVRITKLLAELSPETSDSSSKVDVPDLKAEVLELENQVKKIDLEDETDEDLLESKKGEVGYLLNKTALTPQEEKTVRDYVDFLKDLIGKGSSENVKKGEFFSDGSAIASLSETKKLNQGGCGAIAKGEIMRFETKADKSTIIAKVPFVTKRDLDADSGETQEEAVAYAPFYKGLTKEQRQNFPIYVGSTIPLEQKGDTKPEEVTLLLEAFEGDIERMPKDPKLFSKKDDIAEGPMKAYETVLAKGYYLGDLKAANILFKKSRGVLCDFQTLFNFENFMQNITKKGLDEFINKVKTWTHGAEIAIHEIDAVKARLKSIRDQFDSKTPEELESELRAVYEDFAKIGKFCIGVALYRMYSDYPPCNFTQGGIDPNKPVKDWDKKLLDPDGKLSPQRQKIIDWIKLLIKS